MRINAPLFAVIATVVAFTMPAVAHATPPAAPSTCWQNGPGAYCYGASLDGTLMTSRDLTNSNFSFASMNRASFRNTDLYHSLFGYAHLDNADLSNGNRTQGNWDD